MRAPQLECVHVYLWTRTFCTCAQMEKCISTNLRMRGPQLECAGSATGTCGLRNSNVWAPQLGYEDLATRMCGLRNWNVRAPRFKCASSWAGMFPCTHVYRQIGCMCMSVYVNESICTYASSSTGMRACILVYAYICTCGVVRGL